MQVGSGEGCKSYKCPPKHNEQRNQQPPSWFSQDMGRGVSADQRQEERAAPLPQGRSAGSSKGSQLQAAVAVAKQRQQGEPDSAGDGGWRSRLLTKNTGLAKSSVDTSCASDKRDCLLTTVLHQALHTHS